jgi:endonuclease/exonuclease/phosphatase family metal-dependent hydrolase
VIAASLAAVTWEQRDAIRNGPRDVETHARLLATLPFADVLDVAPAPSPAEARDPATVVAWNAERCKFLDESAAFLAAQDADVLLLSELDWGMARSGQHHCARELASRLGCAYAYGVEFLELDLGGDRERSKLRGQANTVGYHGNAILARGALSRPQLVRLETRGDWFDGARGEARVGGRCAVLAQCRVGGRATTFAAVHLDSHGSPQNRADEMRVLLDAIDVYDRDAPVVIGGDLNAFSLGLADLGDPERVAAALRDDPLRWSNPVPHEPLFALAAERGYAWSRCNAPGESTLRHASEAGSSRGRLKLDWFLCRGVEASAPRVVAAIGPATGGMLSDHEAIAFAMGR